MKPFTGTFGRAEAAHLLRRAAFAAPPEDVDRATKEGLAATVSRLLQPTIDASSDARDAALRASDDRELLAGSWLVRAATTPDPLGESMVLFWHDHFVSALSKVGEGRRMLDQAALFRRLGRGSFTTLATEVARDPAMLRYLDLERTTKQAPNENFARELFELFTTGPGPYGERDIQEAARAFTGYGVRGGRFQFSQAGHDDGEKTVFGVRGRLGGDDVVRIAAARPETSRLLAAKLARRFIADRPADDVVDALAAAWRDAEGDVGRVLATLFASAAFFAPEHRGAVTRCPAAFVVGALRTARATSLPPPAALARRVLAMGRSLFDPPSVKGYAGGASWRNPAARLARIDFVVGLADAHGGLLRAPELSTEDRVSAFAKDALGAEPSAAELAAIRVAVPDDDASRDLRRMACLLARPEFDRC